MTSAHPLRLYQLYWEGCPQGLDVFMESFFYKHISEVSEVGREDLALSLHSAHEVLAHFLKPPSHLRCGSMFLAVSVYLT